MPRPLTGMDTRSNDASEHPPPLRPLRPAVAASAVYAVAALVWMAFGGVLPGGRWVAVHLFTAGVLSNMVMAMTFHFAQTLLHTPERRARGARFALLNVGAVLLIVGRPTGALAAFALGATAVTAAVLWLYLDLRRLRRQSLTDRFAFVVRSYERACGALVHGAVLGAAIGVGLLGGGWYGAARLAHLHLNVLGWGGLTLLATVVFFGPTVMRTRMEAGADASAVSALRLAASGLTVGAVALLVTGAGGALTLPARLVAAAGLTAYAAGSTAVCLPVLRASRRARPSPQAWSLAAACVWLLAATWADVLVVATGRFGLLDTLGAMLLLGVLGQAILGSLGYLTPMIRGRGPTSRAALREQLDRLPRARVTAYNVGAGLVAASAPVSAAAHVDWTVMGWTGWGLVAATGWGLVAATVCAQLLLMAGRPRPLRRRGAGR